MNIPENPFSLIAGMIAGADPPNWLARGLLHWAGLQSQPIKMDTSDHDGFKRDVDKMLWAIDYLERTLPWFLQDPWELSSGVEDETEDTLSNLYVIREHIETCIDKSKGGPKPHIREGICAGVIVEAWALVHGEAPHGRSEKLWGICEAYWLMCGGTRADPDQDPIGRWRRPVEWALEHNRDWITDRLRP